MSKKREVVTAIKDLSASLFYKKVKGDDEEVPEKPHPKQGDDSLWKRLQGQREQ